MVFPATNNDAVIDVRARSNALTTKAGLRHREKELESVLDSLRNWTPTSSSRDLAEGIRWLMNVWDVAMGKTGVVIQIGESFAKSLLANEGQNIRSTARAFYLCISPLEYFIIGLEELLDDAYRDAVTRCGMSCERIINELLREVGGHKMIDSNAKFKDKAGYLQNHLSSIHYNPAEHFCSVMRTVYDIRNQRGPHDVPSADELEAKFCTSSFPWIYTRYLEVVQLLGYDLQENMQSFVTVCNSIVKVSTNLAIKRGHKSLSAGEALETLLYKNGFFSGERSLGDVMKELERCGHNLPKPTVANALESLTKRFLTRVGRPGGFRYRQRMPPSEYYKS